jgi:hypothetical protein
VPKNDNYPTSSKVGRAEHAPGKRIAEGMQRISLEVSEFRSFTKYVKGLGRSMMFRLKVGFLQTEFLLERGHTTTAIVRNCVISEKTQTGLWRSQCSKKLISPINGGMSEGRSVPASFLPIEVRNQSSRNDLSAIRSGVYGKDIADYIGDTRR